MSFEPGFPNQSPSLRSYNDPRGSVPVYSEPLTVNVHVGGTIFVDSNELKAKLSAMVPISNLVQEYIAAAHIDNSVQQFVALWGILTYTTGRGTVAAVETFLYTPGIRTSPVRAAWKRNMRESAVRSHIQQIEALGCQNFRQG